MKKTKDLESRCVIKQIWEERDEWGVSPGGYSYHETFDDLQRFIQNELRKNNSTYSLFPYGRPGSATVSGEIYQELKKSDYGIWGA